MSRFPGEFLACGIDPAKRAHHFALVRYPDELIWEGKVPNRPDAIQQADEQLQSLAAELGLPLVYGTEDAERYGQPLAQLLVAADNEVRSVNPLQVHRQKDFYDEDKTDGLDARSVAAVLLRRRDQLPEVWPGTGRRHALRALSRYYQKVRQHHRRALQQLHDSLSVSYLAAYQEFFGKLDGRLCLAFFERFPTPHELQGQDRASLQQFLLEASNRRMGPGKPEVLAREKAELILELSRPLMRLPMTEALRVAAFMIRQLCTDIRRLGGQLHEIEVELEELLDELDEPLRDRKGINTVLAAGIHGEILSIRRFHGRGAFAKYNGTAPAQVQSGNRSVHVARKRCNRRLKATLWRAALCSLRNEPEARAYYDRCRDRGMKHTEAVKRTARRLSDILYAVLRDWEEERATGRLEPETKKMGEGARSALPSGSDLGASPRPVTTLPAAAAGG